MPRRKLEEHNIRSIQQSNGTYYVTIPVDLVRSLGWRERQNVVVERYGDERIIIADWKPGR